MSYLFEHTVLFNGRLSLVDILCVVVLATVVIYCHRKEKILRQRKKEAEEALAKQNPEESASDA